MACITEIIDLQEVSDGEIVVTLRCCDDPLTDSKHTINLVGENEAVPGTYIVRDATEVNTLIDAQIAKSEARHTAKQLAMSSLQTLKEQVAATKAALLEPSPTLP